MMDPQLPHRTREHWYSCLRPVLHAATPMEYTSNVTTQVPGALKTRKCNINCMILRKHYWRASMPQYSILYLSGIHCGPHIGWISTVISSIYRFNIISLPVENHHVIKRFGWIYTGWKPDQFQRFYDRFQHAFRRYFWHLERVNFHWNMDESDSLQIHPLLQLTSLALHTA